MEFTEIIKFYKSIAEDKKVLSDEDLLTVLKVIIAPDYADDLEAIKSDDEFNGRFNVVVFARLLNLMYKKAPDYWLECLLSKGCKTKGENN